MLEVIDKGPFFAAKGYRSVAVSLRGHGKSPAPKAMHFCSMADLMMLEPAWPAVAERIHAWLASCCASR